MFEQLENTSLAIWVGESLWGYPLMLGLHVVGLAIVVGIFSILNLRLLGAFAGMHFAIFRPLIGLAWVGVVHVASDDLHRKQAIPDQNRCDPDRDDLFGLHTAGHDCRNGRVACPELHTNTGLEIDRVFVAGVVADCDLRRTTDRVFLMRWSE